MSKFHEKQADQIQYILDSNRRWYMVRSATDEHWWLITEDLTECYRIRRQTAAALLKRKVLCKVVGQEFDDNHYQSSLFATEHILGEPENEKIRHVDI